VIGARRVRGLVYEEWEGFLRMRAHSDTRRHVGLSFQLESLATFAEAQSIAANKQRPLFFPGEVA
jgi:hypothetical protein